MKILIVDDNVAIREIVADILTVDGKEVEKAGTVAEAIGKIETFKPDALILDSQLAEESGLTLLDSIEAYPDMRAIILTKGKEVLPKDTASIYGYVQKPFKSNEIMDKVRALEEEMDVKHTKEKKFKFKLFGKHADKEVIDDGLPVRFGKSYVVFENEPNSVYKIAGHFLSKGCDVLILTSEKIKSITERYKDQEKEIKVIGLSPKVRVGYIEMSRLGTVIDQVKKFINERDKPVIIFDNLEGMIAINGLNTVVTMLYQVNHGVDKTSTLVVSTRDDRLTDKDKELFLHDMERFYPQKTEE